MYGKGVEQREQTPFTETHPRQFQFTRAFWDPNEVSLVPASAETLGGKGYGLWVMTRLRIPVPPGFTVATYAPKDAPVVMREILRQVPRLETVTGESFGSPKRPLIVSVRSGAESSMPGILKTFLNIGLNDVTVHPLAVRIGEKAAWTAYYHTIKQFATDISHIDMEEIDMQKDFFKKLQNVTRIHQLDIFGLKTLVRNAKAYIINNGKEFPQDPIEQLKRAFQAVAASWNSPDAIATRRVRHIPEHLGTAVTIQRMVWGNAEGEGSGSGVIQTRNPVTLAEPIVGFQSHIQGVEIVGGKKHEQYSINTLPVSEIIQSQLGVVSATLESHHGTPRDIEFTVESQNGKQKLWILQERKAVLSSAGFIRFLFQQIVRGEMKEVEAMRLATKRILYSLLQPDLDPAALERARENGQLLGTGITIAEGHATAPVRLSFDDVLHQKEPVVLLTNSIRESDLQRFPQHVKGLAIRGGGIGSHIARIAARLGIPGIFALDVNQRIKDGQIITINGTTGEVFLGAIPVSVTNGSSHLSDEQHKTVERWNLERKHNPWRLFVALNDRSLPSITRTTLKRVERLPRYRSRKARVVAAFLASIPPVIRMRYDIKRADDIVGIKRRVRNIFASGFDATLRSGHEPDVEGGKGPWVYLTNTEELEEFFQNPYYPYSKYRGYDTWRANPALTDIFVGQIPKDKLNENPLVKSQHCAWTLNATEDNEIILQIYPHTPHLRDFDDEKSVERFISYTIPYHPKRNELTEYVEPNIGEELLTDLLAKQQAALVEQTVRRWFGEYEIAARLAAMAEIFPVESGYAVPSLQGQARIFPDGSSWILIYDVNNDKYTGNNAVNSDLTG